MARYWLDGLTTRRIVYEDFVCAVGLLAGAIDFIAESAVNGNDAFW